MAKLKRTELQTKMRTWSKRWYQSSSEVRSQEMEVLAARQTFYLTAEHAQDMQTYQSQSGFLESRALQELSWALSRTAGCAWVESEC